MKQDNKTLYTRLFLIRHGQTEHNVERVVSGVNDIPLNEVGHAQAQKMAKRVKEQYPLDVLYTSPLRRTRETASYLEKTFSLSAIPNPSLIEYDFGVIQNRHLYDFEEEDPALYNQLNEWYEADANSRPPRPTIPQAETINELRDRIQTFIDLVLEKHAGQNVAAVSHGGFIKSFLFHLCGGNFNGYVPFWVDNTSITIIDFYKGNPVIRLFNDAHHVSSELRMGRPVML